MANLQPFLDKILHIEYNEDGKSFEELLAEGIRQVNLETVQRQIILSQALNKKERADDE